MGTERTSMTTRVRTLSSRGLKEILCEGPTATLQDLSDNRSDLLETTSSCETLEIKLQSTN